MKKKSLSICAALLLVLTLALSPSYPLNMLAAQTDLFPYNSDYQYRCTRFICNATTTITSISSRSGCHAP